MFGFTYNSPLGKINLESDGKFLTGLWFEGSNDSKRHSTLLAKNCEVFFQTCKWLDIYFAGKEPNLHPLLLKLNKAKANNFM